jgi:hypothetical protein
MNIMAVADIIKALKIERNKLNLAIAALTARHPRRLRGRSVHPGGQKTRRRSSAAVTKKVIEALNAQPAEVGEIGANPPIPA